MSRVDVLRMTQEAATPSLAQESGVDARAQGVQSVKQTKLVGPTAFGTICDVQVRSQVLLLRGSIERQC